MLAQRTALVVALALGACTTPSQPSTESGLLTFKSPAGRAYAYVEEPSGPGEGAPRALARPPMPRPTGDAVILSAPYCPPRLNDGETFDGCRRAAAKTSFIAGPVQEFASVAALRARLPSDDAMRSHRPPISSGAESDRVPEERRNVRLRAFLYAVKKERDNDYHIIVGDAQCRSPDCFFTVEVSGLPRDRRYVAKLREARGKFEAFFGERPIRAAYLKFRTPIPVIVTGPIFYDIDHAPGEIGPLTNCSMRGSEPETGCRPSTSWEIHPVTEIEFEAEPGAVSERRVPRAALAARR